MTAVALLAGAVPAGAVGNGSGGSTEARIVKGPDEVLLPVVGRFAGSTVVSGTCGREVVYEDGVPVDAASPIDVVLDPGHGGPETGSVGANGLVERDLNLIVAFHTKLASRKWATRWP